MFKFIQILVAEAALRHARKDKDMKLIQYFQGLITYIKKSK